MRNANEQDTSRGDLDCLVVGIGASAGGIEALNALFGRVPADSGAAYVVVVHLSPDHESRLAEIIQGHSSIPVEQVRSRVKVMANRAYVVPPGQSLSMDDGHLTLAPLQRLEERRAPIDMFFRTLAETQLDRAVAVVLSGTGADGSSGIARIKECEGLCIAQEPGEALHSEMPLHAIATQLVDHVLLASEIPARIIAYAQRRAEVLALEDGGRDGDNEALREILSHLRARTGHDFSSYKRSTVLRRLQRRMVMHDLPSLSAYRRRLTEDAAEAQVLLKDLLISVTNFFRDPEAFAALEHEVMPTLFRNRRAHEQVRVWVAGCATGEEVYSIAMLLCEQVSDAMSGPFLQVFATDIDESALAKARAGLYTTSDVAAVSQERLRRFFVAETNGYRVGSELREMVLFATHNVLKHPPYGHIDLLTCRNLLIYINPQAQRRIMEVFHFALRPEGFLFLGASESVDGADELFRPVHREARIFQSCRTDRPTSLGIRNLDDLPPFVAGAPARAGSQDSAHPAAKSSHLALHQRLLERYAPPSVVIDGRERVLHLSETAGRYMALPAGNLTTSIVDLARPELRPQLRLTLHEASQEGRRAVSGRVALNLGDSVEHVRIVVAPGDGDAGEAATLVLFDASEPDADQPPAVAASASSDGLANRLQEQIERLQVQLRAALEQHATQQEELKASNEELQSINEELRSASEELETSREELQSYNEELSTVNQELKLKIDELVQANNDTRNLMNSTDTATVFLDRKHRVKRYTARACDLFKLRPGDVGRPLLDLNHSLDYDAMRSDLNRVIETLQTVEREVRSATGRWYISKVLPYRTETDQIEGTVLTFTDITARKAAEEALRVTDEQFRRAIEDAPVPVIMHAEDGQVLQISRSWTALTGYTLSDLPTVDAWLSRAYGFGGEAVREHMHELFSGATPVLDVEFTIHTRTGERRYWTFSASSPGSLRDGRRFVVGMAVDVTESRRAAETLTRSEARLRLLFQSVIDHTILTVDAGGRIDAWNIGAQRMFGYTDTEAIGQPPAFLFTPEDRAASLPEQDVGDARSSGSIARERWLVRQNGERFFARLVLSCVRDGDMLLGYGLIVQDLTSKRQAESALREAIDITEGRVRERTSELADVNAALRREVAERIASDELRVRLLARLVDAQESERQRLSRELHDQFGQQVTALSLKLAALRTMPDVQPTIRDELAGLEDIARQLDADVDHLAWQLRPSALDDFGLVEALGEYIKTWTRHVGIPARFHAQGVEGLRLTSDVETVLYRIAQEALNNVAKHAGATAVDVVVDHRDSKVSLIVEDDGVGFDVDATLAAPSGLGLIGMRERASFAGGTLEIESGPGKGTSLFIRLPVGGGSAGQGAPA